MKKFQTLKTDNDNEKDDEKLTDVLPGEDDPVDCEERELEVKDD